MFSKLGGIFGTLPPRHVETANTRLEIRRDESQSRNKKKNEHETGALESIPWEDIAYVSIASLKAFLMGALHEDTRPASPPVHEASNTANARAANAYQSMGRAVHDSNFQSPPPADTSPHIESHFTESDITRIRSFVDSLIELERKGITELALQRSENFLDAIEAAIAAANT